ncbi:type II toxin-antitoxin system RelE/ParE family toxin [Paludibaculum fermentans]|uniref:Type II toxin-antitoxin system RelE/ParE family toxin n=1 Tax=Paludibaculum fermentans TaxID=1473598 RepID=A0A7S7NVX3_PALFE|nr:type II toxin-antitoxin system RelE/ParE family toxin [Paludibaculum fermentans]QOY90733.1 type II toxin-antitoxin system RelE/ParE family toxin [Paludibaculum fermentans]
MDFHFADRALERLYTHNEGASKYPAEVVRLFLRRVRHIESAQDIRDLRTPRSLHFEKLSGKLAGLCSLRLNDQCRLIFSEEETKAGKGIAIREISKHYGD